MAWRTGPGMGRGMGCPPTGTRSDGLSRSVYSSRLSAELRVAISRQYLMSRDTPLDPSHPEAPDRGFRQSNAPYEDLNAEERGRCVDLNLVDRRTRRTMKVGDRRSHPFSCP